MGFFVKILSENQNAWVVLEKQSQKCIGYITVDIPYPQLGVGEIGYVVGEKYQRKGYAYEAVDCILREYLLARGLYLMEAKYNAANLASGKLLEKLGFRVDGCLRGRRMDFVAGTRNPLVVCSVTREEYVCQCGGRLSEN